jgi:hypothetical protein
MYPTIPAIEPGATSAVAGRGEPDCGILSIREISLVGTVDAAGVASGAHGAGGIMADNRSRRS